MVARRSYKVLFLIIILHVSSVFGLNLQKDISTRNLRGEDKEWVLRELVEGFMSVYKDKAFVINKGKESIIVGPKDNNEKRSWLRSSFIEEFNNYVSWPKEGYKAVGITLKGSTIGILFYQLKENSTIYLAQFALTPQYQKHGIGTYVINAVLPVLHPGYKRYEVLTRHQNDAAILLYKKLGFKIGDIDLVKRYDYDPLKYMSFYKNL